MNNDPNTGNTAFSEGTNATQTNPFTGDLKGEFTSDFGTNTNAVSQIFKGGGMGGGDRNKTILIILAVVAVLAGAFFFLTSPDDGFDDLANEDVAGEEGEDALADEEGEGGEDEAADEEGEGGEDELADEEGEGGEKGEAGAEGEGEENLADGEVGEGMEEAGAAQGLAEGGSTGAVSIASPFDGASLPYDETQQPAMFQWTGAADRIVFSRNSAMNPVNRIVHVAGRTSYRFLHPYPGTWYWRVENSSGASPVQSFSIMPPVRRNFPVSQPAPGGQIAGTGGVVAWQGDTKVARYQVQLIEPGGSWSNPSHRFGTTGTSVALEDVPAGQYDMRVGAFSEVSGRWEWQSIQGVSVQ